MATEKGNPLFDSSGESDDEDTNVDINVENSYAKKYNDWRRKEELQKLKDKYGENLDIMSEIEGDSGSASDSEEEDDEESDSLSDDPFDDDFLKVYSALKCKNPDIYDKSFNVNSATGSEQSEAKAKPKSTNNTKKLSLQEYHRQLIEEKKGITEEDQQMLNDGQLNEDTADDEKPSGYYEELYSIRKEIKDIANQKVDHSDEEDEEFFSVKGNSQLNSKKQKLPSSSSKEQLISTIWGNDKHLDKSEQFLQDFIANKRYLDNATKTTNLGEKNFNKVETHFGGFDAAGAEDANVEEDDEDDSNEEDDDEKVTFAKYHFEEPDANVIKRYPRAVGSIRDTLKSEQKTRRAEVREKKKQEKKSELKRLRKLKREEIESKIQKLKDISGNASIDVKDLDLNVIMDDENDFDMEKYDQKMKLLFGDSFYEDEGNEDKPTFEYDPDIDDDLYGDQANPTNQSTGKANKKRKKDIKQKKDIMADDDIGIYEDIIAGDIATRFKYRMVEPNDFGLTDEEILYGDDKELNKWCSLKKMSQYRSKEEEQYDKKVYAQKSKNLELKKKIFQSLNSEDSAANGNKGSNEQSEPQETAEVGSSPTSTKTKRGKKRRKKATPKNQPSNSKVVNTESSTVQKTATPDNKNSNKKSRKRKRPAANKPTKVEPVGNVSVQRLKAYGMSNREIKKMKVNK